MPPTSSAIETASRNRLISPPSADLRLRCGTPALPGRSPAASCLRFRFGSSFRHHGVLTVSAVASDPPHRLQNLRMGGLPSPHSPQTRSPGLSRLVGGLGFTVGGRMLVACGMTACGCVERGPCWSIGATRAAAEADCAPGATGPFGDAAGRAGGTGAAGATGAGDTAVAAAEGGAAAADGGATGGASGAASDAAAGGAGGAAGGLGGAGSAPGGRGGAGGPPAPGGAGGVPGGPGGRGGPPAPGR